MNLKAFYDKIIVKLIEDQESYYGNIIIPDLGKEKPDMGEVVSVGTGFFTLNGNIVPLSLKVGQIVFVPKFGTQKITYNNEDYLICKESDVLAVLSENKTNLKTFLKD